MHGATIKIISEKGIYLNLLETDGMELQFLPHREHTLLSVIKTILLMLFG